MDEATFCGGRAPAAGQAEKAQPIQNSLPCTHQSWKNVGQFSRPQRRNLPVNINLPDWAIDILKQSPALAVCLLVVVWFSVRYIVRQHDKHLASKRSEERRVGKGGETWSE